MQNENRFRSFLIATAVLVALILLLYWIFPIEKDEMHAGALGGVEKAERFRETTISEENVNLDEASKFEFFQSAAFQNLAKDPDALKRIFSAEFQQLYNESQMTAVRYAADFLKQTEAYQVALAQLSNSGLDISDLESMSDEERQGMAFYSTIYKLADDELKQTLANIDFPIIVLMEQNPSLSMVEWNPPNYTIFSREEDWLAYYCKTIDSFVSSIVYQKMDMNMVSLSPVLSVVFLLSQDLDFQNMSPLESYSVNLATDLALQNAINALNAVNFQLEAQQVAQFTAANILELTFTAVGGLDMQGTFDANDLHNRLSQMLYRGTTGNTGADRPVINTRLHGTLVNNIQTVQAVWSRPDLMQLIKMEDFNQLCQMNLSPVLKQQILKVNGFDLIVMLN